MSFALETIGARRVLFAMAAPAEYGPHLARRFRPLMTGVGPVEAAAAVAVALAGLGPDKPDCIICLGSAGSPVLAHTGIYQAASVSYRDMDASALGFKKGETPFLDLPAEIPLAALVPALPAARLSTGANVVSGPAYAAIDADMVDMETFAVLRAAQRFDVPVLGLRGISDGREPLAAITDWTEYLHVIDEKMAAAVDQIAAAIASGASLHYGAP